MGISLLACQLDLLRPSATPTRTATRTRAAAIPTFVPTTAAPPISTPIPAPVDATATENLRVRASPSTAAAILGRLNKGDTVQVVGRNAAGDWLQIKLPSDASKRGWISAEFATTSAPIDTIPIVPPSGQAYPKP